MSELEISEEKLKKIEQVKKLRATLQAKKTEQIFEEQYLKQELNREKIFTRNLIDNIPYMIYCKDEIPNFYLMNEEFARFYGITPEQHWNDFPIVETPKPSNLKPFNVEFDETVYNSKGISRYLHSKQELHYSAMSGKSLIFGASKDITEQELLRRQLADAKIAEETKNNTENSRKSAWNKKYQELSNLMQEIQDKISSLTESAPLTEDQLRYCEMMNLSAQNLFNVISNLVDFSGIESRQVLELKRGMVDLPSILKNVEQYFKEAARTKSLDFEFKTYPVGLPAYFWGDYQRVFQIIFTAVDNAIKCTSSGIVSITTSFVKSGNLYNLTIQIENSGEGMNRNDFLNLLGLQPFSRLSMEISQSLLGLMGGSITSNSAEDQGSILQLHFPLEEIQLHKTALVINCGQDFVQFLKSLYIEVENVVSYQEAQLKASSSSYHIVFCNLDTFNPTSDMEAFNFIRGRIPMTTGFSSQSHDSFNYDKLVNFLFNIRDSRFRIVEVLASL